jgi:peptidyl-dipeptidase Dcp
MRKNLVAAASAALFSASCAAPLQNRAAPTEEPSGAEAGAAEAAVNPLLAGWTGPHGGVPPFDEVRVEHFEPALLAAMDEYRREVDTIAKDPAAPDFENTIAAMERSGRTFNRVRTVYGIWSSAISGPEFQALERKMAPALAAFWDEIAQNAQLFARIRAVHESEQKSALTPEQQRLVWHYHTTFVRAGASLEEPAKKRMAEINQRLATLFTRFSQNVLGDEEGHAVVLESEADLAGLPQSVRSGAAAAAEARGLPGQWVITNTRSAMEPFLTYSDRRELREQVWRNYVMRGDNGDERDNKALISEILELRAERARLLGYPTHAHWRLENTMAATPQKAMELLEAVWTPAVARVREEVKDMQAIADREGTKLQIAPWDYRHYAEKVRKEKYDLDENALKPYLQLEKLREGMFYVAGELFGFSFTEVTGVPVYHPDVRVWAVKDAGTGKEIGLWYFDPFARPGKRSGAWMNAYRRQERFDGEVTTIVSNNSNLVKARPGEPVLVSWTDATTLFHEFGHALHGLASQVSYPSLSGTAVARDYVEFPSQLLEHWLSTPEVLDRFALHHQTGEPLPRALFERLEKAATFNQGFSTVEYLASALIDMKLHLAGEKDIDPDVFERETLGALGMPEQIVMRHRTPQFSHVFAGDGYSAGYYSYLWSDTITADAFEAFREGQGAYDRAVAERLREHVFSVGNTIDPAEGYRAFRGRDAGIGALMRKRGFPVPAKPPVEGPSTVPARSKKKPGSR